MDMSRGISWAQALVENGRAGVGVERLNEAGLIEGCVVKERAVLSETVIVRSIVHRRLSFPRKTIRPEETDSARALRRELPANADQTAVPYQMSIFRPPISWT